MSIFILLYSLELASIESVADREFPYDPYIFTGYSAVLTADLIILEHLHILSSWENWFESGDEFFWPVLDQYEIDTFVRIPVSRLYLDMGYFHECVHPVVSPEIGSSHIFGGEQRLYIRIGNIP